MITMRHIFAALVRELGKTEGPAVFEWYCRSYGVDITSAAPETVKREVLGI